ncbi:MAG: ATP-binding protein [Anaerolineales bacterium]|nr:ATP-binding protein [Anaerolineales bacterium]
MQPLMATDRTRQLVGRKTEMERIWKSLIDSGTHCRVVMIEGPGGLGKTRILEEVLRRLGQPEFCEMYGPPLPEDDWTSLKKRLAYCDLVDFTNIKLHTREHFIQKLGDPLSWANRIFFNDYIVKKDRYRRMTDFGAAYSAVRTAAQEAEEAFWSDYEKVATKQRLMIPLDTAEQLAIVSSEWLLERELLNTTDLVFATQQWLIEQIAGGKFTNTTLLIAGRGEEGKRFFDDLRQAIAKAGPLCEEIPINLEPFSEAETAEYFQKLSNDWAVAARDEQAIAEDTRATLDSLLSDKDQQKLIWLYTGGQPVRLSMYTDVLIEGRSLPEPLQMSYDEAFERVKTDGSKETPELLQARREIEEEVINLLFQGGGSLQAQILQVLVRAPRGVTINQLHFALDSTPKQDAADWVENSERLEVIQEEINNIKTLAIVRSKTGGKIGLQDEVYRIDAEIISANESSRKHEVLARQKLYQRLQNWAENQIQRLRDKRHQFVVDDLSKIRVEIPAKILNTQMPRLSLLDEQERENLATLLLEAELENLHYLLLLDPDRNFNGVYFRMTGIRMASYNEPRQTMFQAEMWRVMHDQAAFKFISLQARQAALERGETQEQVLRRAAQQDDAVQWIVRPYMRKQYKKAIQLADDIEAKAHQLKNKHEYDSWNHTLARSDRGCWREMARIYSGENIEQAVSALEKIVKELVALSRADINTPVFPERNENGFIGHPAYERLLFLIASTYINLGFGYVSLGDFRSGIRNYAASLRYLRSITPSDIALKATVRNNLSRALVEIGRKRSVRVCEDALDLRILEGQLLPIAYSYNTLGLIWNDLKQPEEALDTSARALAIANYVSDGRAAGLSLLQIGEALRRIATGTVSALREESPEAIYLEAERVLQQAHEIFYEGPASGERVRLIEAKLELGSLYRDWVAYSREKMTPEIWRRRHNNALMYLNDAARLANELKLPHLELDALVNAAWTNYYAGLEEKAESELTKGEQLVRGVERKLKVKARVTKSGKYPDSAKTPAYLFKQLSKMHNLYGQIAFMRFRKNAELLTAEYISLPQQERWERVRKNDELQTHLKRAAESYTLSLAYAQLFAPGSSALTAAYDDLYSFLKKLNAVEMVDFYRYERDFRKSYRVAKLKLENFGDLEEFLLDCFGDYYDPVAVDTAVSKESL